MQLTFPRETVEYLPVTATIDGNQTDTFEVALVQGATRPTVWTSAPLLMTGLQPGIYNVFIRAHDNPETPVLEVGTIVIT